MEKIKLLPLKEQEYMRRLFAGCTEEIRNHMFVMEAEEGKNFIKAGDKCRNIFIILKGRAKGIDMQVQEKIYIFKEFGPGRILGEFECLSGIPYQEIPNFPQVPCRRTCGEPGIWQDRPETCRRDAGKISLL